MQLAVNVPRKCWVSNDDIFVVWTHRSKRTLKKSSHATVQPSMSSQDYGTSTNVLSFLCAVYSRLAYMNDHQYLGHYARIFGDIVPAAAMTALNRQLITRGVRGAFDDTQTFGLGPTTKKKYGLDVYQTRKGAYSLAYLPWAVRVNQVNGEQRLSKDDRNCAIEVPSTAADPNLVFATVATSNYSEVYVTGDKRMPNLVVVTFRGTYSAKSAASYSKPSSAVPIWTSNLDELATELGGKNHERYLLGIYKLLMDVIHLVLDAISHVAAQVRGQSRGDTTIVSTGHSLGGALATVFAYVYVAHVSALPTHRALYPRLSPSIVCVSLGSPRVLGVEAAKIFCCLTINDPTFSSTDCAALTKALMRKNLSSTPAKGNDVVGRIGYMRVVSANDPVPMLPPAKFNFAHPCSGSPPNGRYDAVNQACLTQITNSVSSRCRGTRLSMTYDMALPLNCLASRKEPGARKQKMLANPMGFHTQYLGVSFIGGVDPTSILTNEIKRNKKNTVVRLVLYDGGNKAKVVFFDLVPQRMQAENPQEAIVQAVAEDTRTTRQAFASLLKQTTPYDVEKEKPPIQFKQLAALAPSAADPSFQHKKQGKTMKAGKRKRGKTCKSRKRSKRNRAKSKQ
jgi:hypothetical protein